MNNLQVLKENNFKFKKNFGQNFITDINLLTAISGDANITSDDEVLEIGAGAGTLTAILQEKAKKVVAVEIDKTLTQILKDKFKDKENIEFIFDDILKLPDDQIKKYFSKPFKIVANLPYYITTPIIFKFLEGDYDLTSLTIMVQKEVGDRLTAKSGTKAYGVITAKINAIADTKVCRAVNRNMFTPMPNVDSCIVNIIMKDKNLGIKNKTVFNKLIDVAFSMRRKTLLNNLLSGFSLTRAQAEQVLSLAHLPLTIRGEALDCATFSKVSNILLDFLN